MIGVQLCSDCQDTAVIAGLVSLDFAPSSGGNAKEADRGYTAVGRFVRRGAEKAVIRVTLCNEPGPHQPYLSGWKPTEFGPRILFHREIGANGSNSIQLRSAQDKRVRAGGKITNVANYFN